MFDAVVVGGGAAGMMAAITAAERGKHVLLLEKNAQLGRKIRITGKGRCNITNACDMEELLASVVSNSKFLYSSFYGFTNQDMMDLLEQAGLRLKVERGNRVFPQSDKSSDVISALSALLRQAGVRVCLNQKAEGLAVEEGVCKGVRCGGRIQTADRVIVATGGLSYPATGSTGDGLKWAADSGHRLTDLSPALVPFEVKETETVQGTEGLSLKYRGGCLRRKNGAVPEFGNAVHPFRGQRACALKRQPFCAKAIRKRPLRLVIDLKPALSWEQLDERILRDFSDSRNKQFKNALNHRSTVKADSGYHDRSSVDPDKKVNEITREERRGLAEATKALEFTLTGLRGYKEAIITQGGISVKDVNPSTMESKKIQGLYFAGEILDLDAVTGGFNLQIAWSTGWAAGKAASS